MASAKQLTKKVIITDELSTPEARAQRLRRLRNLANLSRDQMCDSNELNPNTYKGWEIARYGGLPIDGAQRVIKRVSKEGVICSLDWLLYGKGQEPYIIPKTSLSAAEPGSDEETLIVNEITVFQNQFENSIYVAIEDDALSPSYNIGDFVAGIRQDKNHIESIIGHECIVQTKDGKIYVRILKQGTIPQCFNLLSTNSQTTVQEPILYNVKLEFAAAVIRHYKKRIIPL